MALVRVVPGVLVLAIAAAAVICDRRCRPRRGRRFTTMPPAFGVTRADADAVKFSRKKSGAAARLREVIGCRMGFAVEVKVAGASTPRSEDAERSPTRQTSFSRGETSQLPF